jgi:hypothetical protein
MKTALLVTLIVLFSALSPMKSLAQSATGSDQSASGVTDGTNAAALWVADHTVVFDAESVNLSDFVWLARPVVVFANSPNDPQFVRQMDLLTARMDELALRDVIVITDTDPEAMSDIRRALRPRGFMLVLMDKDGEVELRKPAPWDVRELSRSIDKMPTRQQEVEDRRLNGG